MFFNYYFFMIYCMIRLLMLIYLFLRPLRQECSGGVVISVVEPSVLIIQMLSETLRKS